MTDPQPFGFGKLVPGFDFLQSLAQSAVKGAQGMPAVPSLSSWVAPTLSVEEIDKRITELKTVQFWLDQNARALAAMVQALEVQKMTLATLKGMNFSMGDVAKAFQAKTADVMSGMQKASADLAAAAAAPATPAPEPASAPQAAPPAPEQPEAAAASAPPASGVIDPVQWWGALTQQFQQIAANALQDTAVVQAMDHTRNLASDLAREALKNTAEAVSAGVQAAQGAAESVAESVAQRAAKTVARTATRPAAAPAPGKAPRQPAAAPRKSAAGKTAPAKKAAPRRAG